VSSVADKGFVSKLSYKVKCPFTIKADLGHHSFEVQSYDDTNTAKRKYENTKLFVLPPSLFLLDTINQRYLNSKFTPVVNPLKRSMKIELYNDKYLREKGKNTPTYSKINDKSSSLVGHIAFHPHPDISYSLTREMYRESNTTPDTV